MCLGRSNDGQQKAPPFRLGVFVPLRQVHECTTPLDIVVNSPGKWWNAGVPGPNGIFGMTVLTCALKDGADGRWYPCSCQQRLVNGGRVFSAAQTYTCKSEREGKDDSQSEDAASPER
jgi:hypothetical protein